MALRAKNKEGFLTGACRISPSPSIKKQNQWTRCDLMVLRWLLNSITESIRDNVLYAKSSKELWTELMERYGQLNALELYQLNKTLNNISQDNSSLIAYYSSLKHHWKSIDTVDPIPDCSCGALKVCTCQLIKRPLDNETHSKLIQLLMCLNSSYDYVKTHVLSMDPLPPMNKALALLQKIEKQKQISDTSIDPFIDASAYVSVRSESKLLSPTEHAWKKPRLDREYKSGSVTPHYTPLESAPTDNSGTDTAVQKLFSSDVVQGIINNVMNQVIQAINDKSKASDDASSSIPLLMLLDHSGKVVNSPAKGSEGLYKLRTDSSCFSFHVSSLLYNNFPCGQVLFVLCMSSSDLHLLHLRLGHTSVDKMRHVSLAPLKRTSTFFCDTCIKAKHHVVPFQRSPSHALKCFGLLHMDVWRPYKFETLSRARSFLTILDDYSRSTWTYLIQFKSQVPDIIKGFVNYVVNHFGASIKTIRTDNGTEFIQNQCHTFFRDKGSRHESSIVVSDISDIPIASDHSDTHNLVNPGASSYKPSPSVSSDSNSTGSTPVDIVMSAPISSHSTGSDSQLTVSIDSSSTTLVVVPPLQRKSTRHKFMSTRLRGFH
ncbi:hypothetical protein RND81_03G045500 [Saponaria officinalis]|uniref:Integrase catalytic domain-containing protein n=1 Tax=Saponaria officinalis TaxID=3572 RepID=A0AAW1M3B3_SAPOF